MSPGRTSRSMEAAFGASSSTRRARSSDSAQQPFRLGLAPARGRPAHAGPGARHLAGATCRRSPRGEQQPHDLGLGRRFIAGAEPVGRRSPRALGRAQSLQSLHDAELHAARRSVGAAQGLRCRGTTARRPGRRAPLRRRTHRNLAGHRPTGTAAAKRHLPGPAAGQHEERSARVSLER